MERRDGKLTTTVSAALPHMRLRIGDLDSDHRVEFRVDDDQGRTVRTQAHRSQTDTFVFLKTASDARSVGLTLIGKQATRTEFFIAPPDPAGQEGE